MNGFITRKKNNKQYISLISSNKNHFKRDTENSFTVFLVFNGHISNFIFADKINRSYTRMCGLLRWH